MAFYKDDRLRYGELDYLDVYVTRVAKDGSWLDIFVYDNRARYSWTQRLQTPLSEKWSKLR